MKNNFSKSKIIALILSIIAFIWALILFFYLLLMKGTIGFLSWITVGPFLLFLLIMFPLTPLILFIVSLTNKSKNKITIIISSSFIVLSMVLTTVFSVFSNISALPNNLNIYSSNDGYISENDNLNIAVASDSHWGASSSSSSARNQIMDTIKNNNYDLMIHGGDLVDHAFKKEEFEQAINDMENHLGDQRMHFVIGNHDAQWNGGNTFKETFQSKEESFCHVLELSPHVHWIIFDMIWGINEVKSEDILWLEDTLKKYPEDDCVIVESHGYYFASGQYEDFGYWYDYDSTINKLAPIFESNHVDLVVSGHVHSMQMMENNNVHYCLVGPFGGSRFNSFSVETKANSTFLDGEHYGFTSFLIQNKNISVTFFNQDGTSLYQTSFAY